MVLGEGQEGLIEMASRDTRLQVAVGAWQMKGAEVPAPLWPYCLLVSALHSFMPVTFCPSLLTIIEALLAAAFVI